MFTGERGIQSQETTFAVSTANILDPKTAPFTAKGVHWHTSLATDAGFDGIELWSSRAGPQLDIRRHNICETDSSHILSAHLSPRILQTKEALKSRGEIPIAVLLPYINHSLYDLQAMQRQTGDIPVVLYKETPQAFHERSGFTQRLIQPDPELCALWNVETAEDFMQQVAEHGFTGICLDTNHLRRPNKNGAAPSPLADWEKVVPIFLANNAIHEIHVSVGRTDLPAESVETSHAEVKDLLEGKETTDAVKMLRMVAESVWKGPVVLEVLPSSIQRVLNLKGPFVSRKDLLNSYKQIRHNLGQIFK